MDKIYLTCQICKQTFHQLKNLHMHISRSEKTNLVTYYHKFFPRKDMYNGELISFSTFDQYFTTYFSNRQTMAAFFKRENGNKKAIDVAKSMLLNRKNKNGLTLAPTQVELRTINSPSIGGYLSLIDYNLFCSENGLRVRLSYEDHEIKPTNDNIKVIVDTREQHPFKFKKSRLGKVDVGDYTAFGDWYSDVCIDRKNINDFFSTFYTVKSYSRFKKELERADESGIHLFVLVEASIDTCLKYTSNFVKDKGFVPHTFKNVRSLLEKYDNLQFVFCKNRQDANEKCLKILSQGENAKNMDIQYLIDKGDF